MSTLHIALQDGFKNDSVTITVNGRRVYEKSGVTTDLSISLADTVEVAIEGDSAEVTVDVTSRRASGSLTVRVADTPHVAVLFTERGTLELKPSRDAFRYM